MRFIPTRVHGMADYAVGVLLILAPFILGFAGGGAAMWTPILVGAGLLVVSLMTDYELGAVRLIPMPVHLWLDAAAGVILLVSPWLFGFATLIWWPHVLIGLLEIGAAFMTKTHRQDRTAADRTPAHPASVGSTVGTEGPAPDSDRMVEAQAHEQRRPPAA